MAVQLARIADTATAYAVRATPHSLGGECFRAFINLPATFYRTLGFDHSKEANNRAMSAFVGTLFCTNSVYADFFDKENQEFKFLWFIKGHFMKNTSS